MTPSEPIVPSLCVCGKLDCTIPYGTCHCGCRLVTKLADQTYTRIGVKKGNPNQLIRGHSAVNNRKDRRPITYGSVDGKEVAYIPIAGGKSAIVSKHRVSILDGSWSMNDGGYARKYDRKTKRLVLMSRLILGLLNGTDVDHENGIPLDNRDENIRPASEADNSRNRAIYSFNKSGYPGVYPSRSGKRWNAKICYNGKRIFLGAATYFPHHDACNRANVRAQPRCGCLEAWRG